MEVFAARQAILNRRKHAVAYELLFREGLENVFPRNVDPEVATSKLIMGQHLNVGFKKLTQGKKALINYGEKGIIEMMPCLLPANEVVIEILEDTRPNHAVFKACKELYEKGYKLALDDFQYQQGWDKFMPFTRLVKFDLRSHSLNEIEPVFKKLRNLGHLKLLAEKVETYEEFEQAKAMGFDFFQGYFFCKPEMFTNKDIEANYDVIMAIYGEMLKTQLNYDALSVQFEKDVALTYKLLRFINSGAFNLDQPVASIKQALIYLGEESARKFIALVTTAHLGRGKPLELVRISVIRARFCESIIKLKDKNAAESAFLMGLFSLIDAILDKPIEEVIDSLPLANEIKEALIGFKNPFYHLLQLVKYYESGSWYNTQRFANVVQIDEAHLPVLYADAVNWSDSFANNNATDSAPE